MGLLSARLPHLLLCFVLFDDLPIVIWIVPVPAITLCFVAELGLADCLIVPYVLSRESRSNFAWPFNASFGSVGHRAAVGAGSFAIFGYLLVLGSYKAALMIGIDGLFFVGLLLSLMLQSLRTCVLVEIPGCVLDELRHVLEIDLRLHGR